MASACISVKYGYIHFNIMASRRKLWSEEEEKTLFDLHREHGKGEIYAGNKWAVIATKIVDKDDSSVKNKFYSTLRKGLRKINKFITNIKKKRDPQRFKAMKTL